ncbi:hypothetical protein JHD46_07930, partial [Sulfurimonas sp. SAG-AH-194-C20]
GFIVINEYEKTAYIRQEADTTSGEVTIREDMYSFIVMIKEWLAKEGFTVVTKARTNGVVSVFLALDSEVPYTASKDTEYEALLEVATLFAHSSNSLEGTL